MDEYHPHSINKRLPNGIDINWQSRIEQAFVPENPRGMSTEMGRLVLQAVNRNLEVAGDVRRQLIERMQFVSYESAEEAYVALDGTGQTFDDAIESNAIVNVRDHNKWIFPAFQFEKGVSGLGVIREVQGQFASEPRGWAVASWWGAGHPRLNWHSPEEVFKLHPAFVLRTVNDEDLSNEAKIA